MLAEEPVHDNSQGAYDPIEVERQRRAELLSAHAETTRAYTSFHECGYAMDTIMSATSRIDRFEKNEKPSGVLGFYPGKKQL